MTADDIKFYLFLFIPLVLIAVFVVFLILARSIPSPVFIYNFIESIISPVINLLTIARSKFLESLYGKTIFLDKSKIPQEVLNRIGPLNLDKILSVIKINPPLILTKDSKAFFRTYLIISNEFIYFVLYIKGRSRIDLERVILNEISLVEAKSKEVMELYNKPYISIKLINNTSYVLFFPAYKKAIEQISEILEMFKTARNDINILVDLPKDFRSTAVRDLDEVAKAARDESNKDL
ncbi:MAG: hypothetical protein A2075_00510 [Geobacteraceae bacterium GWC2_58_44]|nr:MAG: hypothetical protein A2075_00510 [Geobacteraceae bacterium GWC2_58_44]HBG06437.1 hypothetical protein [Geobacter sp.]